MSDSSAESDGIEQAFIDAVMDTVVSQEVGDLNLRVRDVVTIAKWLAPVHAALVGSPAKCDTCNDTHRVPWMVEADPNLYQEPDADGTVPCPDCGTTSPPGASS